MHMPSGRLINHHSTRQCDKNMQMLWQRRDIVITSQCAEVFSSIKGEDGAECIEGVGMFKYMGRLMDRLDNNWPAVHRNIRKARQVWGILGNFLRREGVDPFFFRKVLPGSGAGGFTLWGIYLRRKWYGTWKRAAVEIFIREAGTQTLGTYIDRLQATVAEWVALRSIYEVCEWETDYEGRGRHREPWWRETAARK